ncbi:ABC transporter permease [Polyangium mundeleinium]|uniref:ABC transporter permease subunit n=1 Tax=Polyangium mundeleinium TaxID=2995306 RepID=A0ABT5ES36_9BACT|nr:ABC transporter permease subunit [Polyangium mundeleinium]MDC0744294.1 ABC transporter permease subunit [Polyangium mundeleinium]
MRNALLVAGREIGSYGRSLLGWAIGAAALLVEGVWFSANGLSGSRMSADVLREFFNGASGVTMIVAVLMSIPLLAGERERGTLVLLNTAPIRDIEIIVGKYLAAFAMIALITLVSVYMPLLIFVNGKVSLGHVAVGYTGILLLGSAALALGMFTSAVSRSQVMAAILGGLLLAVMVTLWLVAKVTEPPVNGVLAGMALHHQRQFPFMTGVLKLENVVYYVAVTYFFLLAATKTLEARRWR